jgi:hypothetical protein
LILIVWHQILIWIQQDKIEIHLPAQGRRRGRQPFRLGIPGRQRSGPRPRHFGRHAPLPDVRVWWRHLSGQSFRSGSIGLEVRRRSGRLRSPSLPPVRRRLPGFVTYHCCRWATLCNNCYNFYRY